MDETENIIFQSNSFYKNRIFLQGITLSKSVAHPESFEAGSLNFPENP